MVLLIRQNETIRQQPADRAERRLIGHIAGREGESGLLAVQIREFRLERDDGMAITGAVAGTSGPGAHPPRRLDHGIDDTVMTPHPELVVRTPYYGGSGCTDAAPGAMGWALGVPL